MTWPLLALGAAAVLELSLWTWPLKTIRKQMALLLSVAIVIASTFMLIQDLNATTLAISVLGMYRLVNLARIAKARIHATYLRRVALRTTLCLAGLQTVAAVTPFIADRLHTDTLTYIYAFAAAQLAITSVLLASTLRNVSTTKPPKLSAHYTDNELPTLTVAIPARNETADLEACLISLIASTYPKLEIIVLDDSSQDKRTPEIIRDFAQNGVRFLAGETPPDTWTAKNYAYSQLTKAANGEVILFCGVDTRFEPHTLTNLVKTLLQKDKSMISIMPQNIPNKEQAFMSQIVQANRYSWELSLPRRLLDRPPVLSTCWLIRKKALQVAGGFEAVRRSILPEAYLAKKTASLSDGYSFLHSTKAIGLTTQKLFTEQLATAVRVRYPQLHRRPELVALLSVAQYSALVLPLIMFIVSAVTQLWWLALLTATSFVCGTIMYAVVVTLTYRKIHVSSLLLLPFAALYDIGILNYSMWRYEFREVIWKDRDVRTSVMHTIPSLPPLPEVSSNSAQK